MRAENARICSSRYASSYASSIYAFLIVSALAALVVWASGQASMISIGDASSSPGGTNVTVPIYLDSNVSVAGFQFDISHSPFLVYKGYALEGRASNATVVANNETPGLLKVAALIPGEIEAGTGKIMDIVFDISSNATSGDYPMNFSNLMLGDIVAQPVNTTPDGATFTITADSDGDGIDDADDACPAVAGCSGYSGCQYGIKEWLPPITIEENFTLQEGSTLPLKFNVTNCSDAFVEDYGVLVNVYNDSLNFSKEYNATGEGDDYIRINATDVLYIVNVHTNELDMPLGFYTINASLGNGMADQTGFILIEKGVGKGKHLD